ncbi:hypothetical protein EZ428_01265 [Pedobacter frigiditerrae]|uniref:Uncharacterized protein n=1 Tax=Pedobacter frigiditerrae TaxID=2530452 RepID=A0A4R0N168_9SPHI|nr:hypothetical protein [Pedobacter frigiditerrae]TCC93430.1 hypothetical protein EZ428_01265 [Pedobacter frigiditerrae]
MLKVLELPYALIIEWMCLITSILFLRNVYPKFWRVFIPFLTLTIGVESYGYYTAIMLPKGLSNAWLYNLFLIVYVIFYTWIFSRIIPIPGIKKIVAAFLAIIGGLYFWEFNYNKGLNELFFYRTNNFFSVGVVIFCISYYFSLFRQLEYINILEQPEFWFVSGCLIFYATSTCVNSFFSELIKIKIIGNFRLRYFLMCFLSLIMYSCWIKSFLCFRKIQNSLPQ